ncbi:MHO_1580 family protein [Mycoplasma sp. 'Moose RK']|uniref:MHO_1580 family protein n=1 Tax=Mycoplasma sp. 'Moose RK' TaxID=2780095 RepID=UPI0018C2F927|nr:hypothetical protein [Mycoplasma sp. 'Moose RK']MBG0730494.1 hypothetical protein [Mycoplasma sp. 'Moose RK']
MHLELAATETPEIQIARNYGQISFNFASTDPPNGIRQFVKIERDLTSDHFNVIVTVFSKIAGTVNVFVQINNMPANAPQVLNLLPEKFNQAVFSFGSLDIKSDSRETGKSSYKTQTGKKQGTNFQNISNILVYLTKENDQKPLLDNVVKIRNFTDVVKEYSIQNSGIGFKFLKSIRMANLGADASIEYSKTYEQIEENTIYFFPYKFDQLSYNKNVLKVGVDYETFISGNLDRKINISGLKLINLPIKTPSDLDLTFQFRPNISDPNFKPEIINKKYIIGDIIIKSNTYYDGNARAVFKGNSQLSQQGFVVPYNFSGTLNPKVQMNINNDYEQISVGFAQEIPRKLIDYDKKSGIYKLKIINYSTPFIKSEQIHLSNRDFKYIASNFLTIEQLRNLSPTNFKEDDEQTLED